MESEIKTFETREVLAGAYRGKRLSLTTTLTHLASDGIGYCNKKLNLADAYSLDEEGRKARPTCPKCAAKWDQLNAGKAAP